jgi:DNA mismatch repair protein MSH4
MTYLETNFNFRVVPHSLRVRYQPSEGTMMIDISAIQSFELLRNPRDLRPKNCMFGLLNLTLTPMGARMLRSNIVQPSTLKDACLTPRYDAIEELIEKEETFTAIRKGTFRCGIVYAVCH